MTKFCQTSNWTRFCSKWQIICCFGQWCGNSGSLLWGSYFDSPCLGLRFEDFADAPGEATADVALASSTVAVMFDGWEAMASIRISIDFFYLHEFCSSIGSHLCPVVHRYCLPCCHCCCFNLFVSWCTLTCGAWVRSSDSSALRKLCNKMA